MKKVNHFYAINNANGTSELHRFVNRQERDGWVNGDTRNRSVLIRRDVELGKVESEFADVFYAPKDETPWVGVDGHDVLATKKNTDGPKEPVMTDSRLRYELVAIRLDIDNDAAVLSRISVFIGMAGGENGKLYEFVIEKIADNLAGYAKELGKLAA